MSLTDLYVGQKIPQKVIFFTGITPRDNSGHLFLNVISVMLDTIIKKKSLLETTGSH